MTEKEFKEYKKAVEEEYGECTIYHVPEDCEMFNCGKTGEREAPKSKTWTEFWQAMTEIYSKELNCSSCGKELFVGNIPSLRQHVNGTIDLEHPERNKSHGGHVWLEAPEKSNILGGRYITPLCPKCNGQHDKHILIKAGSLLCKEITNK